MYFGWVVEVNGVARRMLRCGLWWVCMGVDGLLSLLCWGRVPPTAHGVGGRLCVPSWPLLLLVLLGRCLRCFLEVVVVVMWKVCPG